MSRALTPAQEQRVRELVWEVLEAQRPRHDEVTQADIEASVAAFNEALARGAAEARRKQSAADGRAA